MLQLRASTRARESGLAQTGCITVALKLGTLLELIITLPLMVGVRM